MRALILYTYALLIKTDMQGLLYEFQTLFDVNITCLNNSKILIDPIDLEKVK